MTTHYDLTCTVPLRRRATGVDPESIGRQMSGPPVVIDPGDDGWQRRYLAAVVISDVTLIALSVTVGLMLVPADGPDAVLARVGTGVLAGLLMVLGLGIARAWDPRVLGAGAAEYRRLYQAVLGAAGTLGLAGLALQIESVRPWVFIIMPAAAMACLIARYAMRRVLHHARSAGRCMLPVLAVGSEQSVADLIRRTRRADHFGWQVTGACTPTGSGSGGRPMIEGVPVVGDLDAAGATAVAGGYRVVAVAPAPGWGPGRLQQLAWQLEASGAELAVDPGLMEIAGPRLHITPIDGLPLLQLSQPSFTGGKWLLKQTIDRVGAAVLLLLTAPLLLAVAVAVRLDGGPALYLQERVGVNGRSFRIFKFRSMVVDADREVTTMAGSNDGAGPLFKMREDPRITGVGRLLRKYSLDELPQLLNVLGGSMSLVGPRPPLPSEVAEYGPDARRRLLVRPGMTGLWQVSGRSDLSWAESVRLDLRYVENWSLALDASIAWKTVGAVLRCRGAY